MSCSAFGSDGSGRRVRLAAIGRLLRDGTSASSGSGTRDRPAIRASDRRAIESVLGAKVTSPSETVNGEFAENRRENTREKCPDLLSGFGPEVGALFRSLYDRVVYNKVSTPEGCRLRSRRGPGGSTDTRAPAMPTSDTDAAVPPKPKKATNAVVLQRVEEVLAIRLDGAQLHDIRRYASENGWGVSDRQLERYIEKADQLLVERRQRKWKRLTALHVARREALYARALQAADFRTALAVLQDMAKLQNLYMDEKKLKQIERELRELEGRLKVVPIPEEQDDSLVAMLNGLPTDDKVRLAKLLRERGYNPGTVIVVEPDPVAG